MMQIVILTINGIINKSFLFFFICFSHASIAVEFLLITITPVIMVYVG